MGNIGDIGFRGNCLGALFVLFDDDTTKASPTVTVIVSALASEYLESSLLPPSHLLQGLASRLSSNGGACYLHGQPCHPSLMCFVTAAIQDALLLSMLRVAADCEEVSDGIISLVRKIQERAGRHIRRVG
jgi:AP-4 complex subunit epsilon-1